MKKGFSCKSDNLHLNRIATASVFAIRFKCKSFLPAGKTWLPKNPLRAGKRPGQTENTEARDGG
jgi:hypothetical protein